MTILEVHKLSKNFGGLRALIDLNVKIESGELTGLIGPNGAGKSTFFDIISGFTAPSSGKIIFSNKNITGLRPNQIAKRGLVRTFQATRLFENLTIRENVEAAGHIPTKKNFIENALDFIYKKNRNLDNRSNSNDILKLAGLEKVENELAKNLPHGYQRILGVAIALAAKPKLLCLDEPVTGMNAKETQFMIKFIKRVQEKGVTVLLIEHSMKVVMDVCTKIFVLNFGKKIAEGTCAEIKNNNFVIEAYLGRQENNATQD